jgi:hypothetical protein
MARGGKRPGAGGRPSWNYGKTKPIRVPIALADIVIEIAKRLDRRGVEGLEELENVREPETESKIIDLTGIAIRSTKDGPAVYLVDLVKAGYEIKPAALAQSLRREPSLSLLNRQIDEALERLKRLEEGV